MNLSDQFYLLLSIALVLPIALLLLLNFLMRNHGGFAKGWASGVFILVCWVAALLLILWRVSGRG